MELVFLIIWSAGVGISLCAFFSWPQKIFLKFHEYRFPNYSRKFTKKENKFIDQHIDLLQAHQSDISNTTRPFVLGQWSFALIFCLLLAVLLALFIFSPKLSELLTDLGIGKPNNPSLLVDPYPSILLFAFSIFFIFIWVIAIQLFAIKNDTAKLGFLLLIPHNDTKIDTDEFYVKTKEIVILNKRNLCVLLRKGVLDSSRTYTLEELIGSLSRQQSKQMIRLVFSTITFLFLLYIMDTLNFTKVSKDKITYSPAFSFRVTSKTFEDVKSVGYICENQKNSRYLKMRVTLNDGYTFKVRKHNFEKMPDFLEARKITTKKIEERDEWCRSLKF